MDTVTDISRAFPVISLVILLCGSAFYINYYHSCSEGTCTSLIAQAISADCSLGESSLCGNHVCEAGENLMNCKEDCHLVVVPSEPECGDGFCNLRGESHFDCPEDCTGDYYIIDHNSPECDDKGQGTLEDPLCSISEAIDRINYDHIGPGDTIYLRDGQQYFLSNHKLYKGGEPGRYITFRNYPSETPIVELGIEFQTVWTLDKSTEMYNIWKAAVSPFGPYDEDAADYPSAIFVNLENPLSRMLSYDDLTEFLEIKGVEGGFDAYLIDCSDGDVYIRLQNTSMDPNEEKIYYHQSSGQNERRFVIKNSYIQLIGLTIQHGWTAVKFEIMLDEYKGKQPYQQLVQHLNIYDNTIRSTRMAISDHIRNEEHDNFIVIYNNTFLNIAPEVEVERQEGTFRGDSRTKKCLSELEAADWWRYVCQRWDHVTYSSSYGTLFSHNYVDTGGTKTAVIMNKNWEVSNNIIIGDLRTADSSSQGFVRIHNNIIENQQGYVLYLVHGQLDAEVFNNIIIGNGTAYWRTILMGAGAKAGDPKNIEFKNNIVVDNSGSDMVCIEIWHEGSYDFDNNVYVGCKRWRNWINLGDILADPEWMQLFAGDLLEGKSLEEWRAIIGGETESFTASMKEVFEDYDNSDYRPPSGSRLIASGECLLPVDIEGRQRGSCDIGPYTTCGNAVCQDQEDARNCPQDCIPLTALDHIFQWVYDAKTMREIFIFLSDQTGYGRIFASDSGCHGLFGCIFE